MAQADPVRLAVTVGFIGASLFAGYGGYRVITGGRPVVMPQVQAPVLPGTPVLTAATPIARGTIIAGHQLHALMVQGTPPAGSFSDPEALVGKVATVDILPGQTLLPSMASTDRAEAGLAILIPAGKRAIAIPIAEDVAVSNLIRAGDLVDVLLVLRAGVLPHAAPGQQIHAPGASGSPVGLATPGEPGDASETRVLLQAVPVLTVGQHIGEMAPPPESGGRPNGPPPRPEPSRTMTLALTPEQAETLALARTLGTLELALRNPSDKELSGRPAITLQELRGAAIKPTVEAAVDPRRPIELIIGNEHRTIYSLDSPPAPTTPASPAPAAGNRQSGATPSLAPPGLAPPGLAPPGLTPPLPAAPPVRPAATRAP